jgi:hypothetical protein
MKSRLLLLAACLLAAPVQAQGLFGGQAEEGQIPSRFVEVDGLAVGMSLSPTAPTPPIFATRLASVTCVLNRFRFGLSYAESYNSFDEWSAYMSLPVRVGFTIWSNPKATWLVWGHVPAVYAEVSGALWEAGPWSPSLRASSVRASLCCDVDYFGVGARAEAGVFSLPIEEHWRFGNRVTALYFGIQLRALTFGIGF